MDSDALELIDAALLVCDAVLPASESLRHEKHAKIVKPIRARVKKIFAGYFRRQCEAVLAAVKLRLAEAASPDAIARAAHLLPSSLHPLKFAITQDEHDGFNNAIRDAITRASKQLATELETGDEVAEDTVGSYLRNRSMSQVTGDLSSTTLDRLRTAVAGTYDAGGTAEEIEQAIKDTFDNFSDARAEMIAQTEVNAAYNFGRTDIAMQAGMEEKAWSPDGTDCCDDCQDCVDEGFIPIEDSFPLGLMPPGHPRCDCGLDFRMGGTDEGENEKKSPVSPATPITTPEKFGPNDLRTPTELRDAPRAFTKAIEDGIDDVESRTAAKQVKIHIMKTLAERLADDEDFGAFAETHTPRNEPFSDDPTERAVADLVANWAATSGDDDDMAIALQLAAEEEFGVDPWQEFRDAGAWEDVETLYKKHGKALRAFLRAQYDETQAWLKEHNLDSVTVFRGMHDSPTFDLIEADAVTAIEQAKIPLQAMSSFSSQPEIAYRFTSQYRGSMLAAKVPRKRVLSVCRTGFGCLDETEAVVLGGPGEIISMAWDSETNRGSSGMSLSAIIKAMEEEIVK